MHYPVKPIITDNAQRCAYSSYLLVVKSLCGRNIPKIMGMRSHRRREVGTTLEVGFLPSQWQEIQILVLPKRRPNNSTRPRALASRRPCDHPYIERLSCCHGRGRDAACCVPTAASLPLCPYRVAASINCWMRPTMVAGLGWMPSSKSASS